MIKANKGKVKLNGSIGDLLTEYTFATRALIEALAEDGFPREVALDAVAEAYRVGTLTEQEVAEEAMKKAAKTMMEISNRMLGNKEESEETEDAE